MHNEVITRYIHAMRDTQSPQQYHAWTLVCSAAAAASRRICLRRGPLVTYPNLFVILVGDPGARKSTAISFADTITKHVTCINRAPTSTGGHIQGIISTMRNPEASLVDNQNSDSVSGEDVGGDFGIARMLDNIDNWGASSASDFRPGDKHALWVVRDELMTLFSSKGSELPALFCELFDNKPSYTYRLKKDCIVLEEPTIGLLGGATPANIATMFPDNALDQGIASRTIFVYGEQVGDNYWPEDLPDAAFAEVQSAVQWIADQAGEMKYTAEFREHINDFCRYVPDIEDVRFASYNRRRALHLVKVAMCCALLRKSMCLDVCDLEDANAMLAEAEKNMPEALGEFGMSPEAIARRRVALVLKEADEPITWSVLSAMAGRDVSTKELAAGIRDLTRMGKIKALEVTDPSGQKTSGWVWKRVAASTLVQALPRDFHIQYPVTADDAKGRRAVTEAVVAEHPKEKQPQPTRSKPRGRAAGKVELTPDAVLAALRAKGQS